MHSVWLDSIPGKNIHFTTLGTEHIVWFFCHRTWCLVVLEWHANPLPHGQSLHLPLTSICSWSSILYRFLIVLQLPLYFFTSIFGSHNFFLLKCSCRPSQVLTSCSWFRVPLTCHFHEAYAYPAGAWQVVAMSKCSFSSLLISFLQWIILVQSKFFLSKHLVLL